MDTTFDGLLDRRVSLEQPQKGYRVAIDTVLLAAAVKAHKGDAVLDLGCGVGGATLCLARRVSDIRVVGIDIQPDLVRLCKANIERNEFRERVSVVLGDATDLPASFDDGFDHVLMNPPYHDEKRHEASPDAIKRIANTAQDGDLALWIASAGKALRRRGTLTLIHRADRLEQILLLLKNADFGGGCFLPIVTRIDARHEKHGRIIVYARKADMSEMRECQPLVMHKDGGGFSDEAEDVLRHMKALDLLAK